MSFYFSNPVSNRESDKNDNNLLLSFLATILNVILVKGETMESKISTDRNKQIQKVVNPAIMFLSITQ